MRKHTTCWRSLAPRPPEKFRQKQQCYKQKERGAIVPFLPSGAQIFKSQVFNVLKPSHFVSVSHQGPGPGQKTELSQVMSDAENRKDKSPSFCEKHNP